MFNNKLWRKKIRLARQERQWSHREMARHLRVTTPTAIHWETYGQEPRAGNFLFVCSMFNLDPQDFYDGRD